MLRRVVRDLSTTRFRKKLSLNCIGSVSNLTTSRRRISVFSNSEPNGASEAWQKALSDAEKIVGFPTSFLSLRALLSDEFGGLALHLRKLISTKHPLLNTAKGIIFGSKNYMQTRGLVMLLIAKASDSHGKGKPTDVHEKLRSLAEITELIHIAFLVHRGIIDVKQLSASISKMDADFGNKLAVLGGDFMLANACTGLAKLENTEVVDLISASIGDMSSSLVILPENDAVLDKHVFYNMPTKRKEWEKMIRLANGSLLAKSCRSALLLSSVETTMVHAAEKFAYHLVLAQQAKHDITRFASIEALDQKPNFSSLCCLPVVLMAEERGGTEWLRNFVSEYEENNVKVQNSDLCCAVAKHGRSLIVTQQIAESHINAALTSLEVFPSSEAKSALENIVRSVKK